MSEFVKNKTGQAEGEGHASTDATNISAPKGLSKKTKIKDLHQDTSAKVRTGQCHYIKPDNSPCDANALRDSFYCFFHDPDRADEREAARIKGGKERSRKAAVLPADTPDRPLTTAADITELLGETINQVRRGELDPKASNAVCLAAGLLLKAQLQEQLERRLKKIESIVAQKWANQNFASVTTPENSAFEFVKAETGGEA